MLLVFFQGRFYMLKRIIISIALCLYITPFLGCTSNNSKDDTAQLGQDVTDLEAVEGVDIAADTGLPQEATVEPVSPIVETTPEEQANVDSLPQDPLADVESAQQNIADSKPEPIAELPQDPAPVASSIEQPAEIASQPVEPPMMGASEPPPPMTETNSLANSDVPKKEKKSKKNIESFQPSENTAMTTPPPPPEEPVLQKIIAQPWRDGDVLFNAVYFARGGESFSSISKKIYGTSKKQDLLKKGNPGISKVKAGDALYYSSANRPDDDTKVLTFAEDNGLAPEVYVSKAGDNLKVLSKKLLGYSGAWKEVWATNNIESTTEVPEGTELRYWKPETKSPAIAKAAPQEPPQQPVVMNEAPPAPTTAAEATMPAPPTDGANLPQVANEIPPSTNDAAVAAATSQELPPPPPPAVIPQDPPMNLAKEKSKDEKSAEVAPADVIDQETLNMLIALAIVSAGVVAFVIVRKKRKNKEMEQILESTQVG